MGIVVPQPLAYSECAAYARDHGFADTLVELNEFLRLMRAMDAEFRAYEAEERAKGAPPNAPPGAGQDER